MFKRTRLILAVCVALCALAVGVASASAATVYVSNSAPASPGGKSCSSPTYAAVQEAISAGATKVKVCPGTYVEQLAITGPVKLEAANGAGTATVAMPEEPANSPTACDVKNPEGQIDEISICTPATVSITGLKVEAEIPLETCAKGFYGIFIGDGGTLKGTNLTVNGASTTLNAYKGCQHGVAIVAGSAKTGQVGHAILSKVSVSGYEKNGPTVVETGSTMTVSASTVIGEGATPYIAQNGIEVAFGGKGVIKSTSVSGNECNVASCGATGEQASGVLFYQAASGSSLASSVISENDMGVYYATGSNTVPASADVTLNGDVLTSNRYEGVLLEEGKAALKSVTINGSGRVGIDLYQASYQESASESSATKSKISGQSEASIKVESDKSPSDIPGTFVFSKGTAAAPVLINESNNFVVEF